MEKSCKSKNEAKEQKGGFIGLVLGTLRATLLANILTNNGVKQTKRPGWGIMEAGEEAIRADQDL